MYVCVCRNRFLPLSFPSSQRLFSWINKYNADFTDDPKVRGRESLDVDVDMGVGVGVGMCE